MGGAGGGRRVSRPGIPRQAFVPRCLEPGEERAVAQMLEGFHNLLRYMLSRSQRTANPPGETPAAPEAGCDDDDA